MEIERKKIKRKELRLEDFEYGLRFKQMPKKSYK